MEIYAWDGDFNRLLLIGWRKPNEWNDWGGVINTTPYPYVVNGAFELEKTDTPGVLQAPWDKTLKAHYVCQAPDGNGYNDILSRVKQQIPLFI